MKAHLNVVKGPGKGSTCSLSTDDRTIIGRDSGKAQFALDDAKLSRAHCVIVFQDDVWILRDLESANGTFVNDQEIFEVELRAGDRITVGSSELDFHSEERKGKLPTHPKDSTLVSPNRESTSLPNLNGISAPELDVCDLLGETLGDFQILEKISESGQALLYRARWRSKDREVALKIVRPEVALDQMALARFARGAHAGSRFGHPNVCKMYGAGRTAGLHYIVMEHICGSSVEELMRTRGIAGMFDPSEALDVAVAVAEALSAAHGRGLIHRDINPSHIMITEDHQIKLVGLGVAKSLAPSAVSPNVTVQDALVGTLNYMAPEATVDATDVTAQSDVYSLGACLFAMITGKTPFESLRRTETIQRIRREDLPSPRQFNMSIPEDLCTIVAKATKKLPSERYPSMAVMLESLHAARKRLKR